MAIVAKATAKDLEGMIKMGWVSPEGIVWNEDLAGPDGMSFTLFPGKHHTKEDIEATKSYLRNSRDVVSVYMGKFTGRKYPWPVEVPVWTPEQREAGFRKIVAEKAFGPIEDCVAVDLFTAQNMVQTLDKISPKNKAWLLKYPASKMIDLMWAAINSAEGKA